MEDRRAGRPWARWLLLAAAVIELWLIGYGIWEYRRIAAADTFSPETLAVWAAGERFRWLICGTLALEFLFYFLTWKTARDSQRMRLAEAVLYGLMAAVWLTGACWLPFSALEGWKKLLWGLMTLIAAGGMAHSLSALKKRDKKKTGEEAQVK